MAAGVSSCCRRAITTLGLIERTCTATTGCSNKAGGSKAAILIVASGSLGTARNVVTLCRHVSLEGLFFFFLHFYQFELKNFSNYLIISKCLYLFYDTQYFIELSRLLLLFVQHSFRTKFYRFKSIMLLIILQGSLK